MSTLIDITRARRNAAHCSSCAMRHLCMPEGLCANDIAKLENIISVTRKVKRGDALFRTGDHFDALFAVRSGSIKTVVSHSGGREQVTGLPCWRVTLWALTASRKASIRATPSRSRTAPYASCPTRSSSVCAAKPTRCKSGCIA